MSTTTLHRPHPAATRCPAPTPTPTPTPTVAAAGTLRLTRRGRAVLVLVLLAALLGIGFTIGRASQSRAGATAQTTVVRPGDTLWSIAARTAPDRDTRQVVAAIAAANHLSGASLQVGERLTVPA